jgi:hypothetical protein
VPASSMPAPGAPTPPSSDMFSIIAFGRICTMKTLHSWKHPMNDYVTSVEQQNIYY